MCSVKVEPPIADHCIVSAIFDVHTLASIPIQREVWHWKSARWQHLRRALREHAWDEVFSVDDPNLVAERFTEAILSLAQASIKINTIETTKCSHPWLTQRAQNAIQRKCDAYGTSEFANAARECHTIAAEEFRKYQSKLKKDLADLPRGSKRWWRANRELLDRKASLSSVSPLKTPAGEWLLQPESKANHLAEIFKNKSRLPPAKTEAHAAQMIDPAIAMSGFLMIRARVVRRALKKIDDDKATGPDGLPGKILRICHAELAGPIARLCRLLLLRGVWPESWRVHWLCPLHKRGAMSAGNNYRGVHLTSILSKIVERAIGSVFLRS